MINCNAIRFVMIICSVIIEYIMNTGYIERRAIYTNEHYEHYFMTHNESNESYILCQCVKDLGQIIMSNPNCDDDIKKLYYEKYTEYMKYHH